MALDSTLSFLTKLERSCGLDEFPKYRQEDAGKSDSPFLLLFVGFTLSVYIVETYLDLRQHRNLKAKSPPSALLEVLKTVDEDNKGLEAVSKVGGNCFRARHLLRFSGVLLVPPRPCRRLSWGANVRCFCNALLFPTVPETNILAFCCSWPPPHDVPHAMLDERNIKQRFVLHQVESKFLASQAYGLDKNRFHSFESAFDLVLGLASNLLGWMPWLWDVSAGLVAKTGFEGWGGDIPTSLCFVALTMVMQVRPFV